jgi:hypothetical protein
MDFMENNSLNGFEQREAREVVEPIEQSFEEIVEKPYHLRRLCADDIFLMVRLLSKIGLKEFKSLLQDPELRQGIQKILKDKQAKEEEKEDVQEELETEVEDTTEDLVRYGGFFIDIAQILLINIGVCKGELYALLGAVSEMSAIEIGKMDLLDFTNMIIDFCKKEEFKNFTKVALRFVK